MEMNSDTNFHDFPPLTLSSSSSTHSNPRKKRTKFSGGGAAVKPIKKPDPSAPKITPPCTECGKKFWSFKALFGHMRCHPERRWRGINPPPLLRRSAAEITADDHEVAAILLTLANTNTATFSDIEDLSHSDQIPATFEGSGCKKVFGSRQALGGHRASGKNVKGCCANKRNDGEDLMMMMVVKDDGGHRCGVCFRVFSSGQALGGHMRCHWEKVEEGSRVFGSDLAEEVAAAPRLGGGDGGGSCSGGLTLDLRLGF